MSSGSGLGTLSGSRRRVVMLKGGREDDSFIISDFELKYCTVPGIFVFTRTLYLAWPGIVRVPGIVGIREQLREGRRDFYLSHCNLIYYRYL